MMYKIHCTIASLDAIVWEGGVVIFFFFIKIKLQIISFRMQKRQYGWFFMKI